MTFIDAFKALMDKNSKAVLEVPLTKEDKKRAEELHMSSAPYCFIRHYKGKVENKDFTHREVSFSSDYFLNVGTLAHEIFQKWYSLDGKIIGDWECKCGNKVKFVSNPYCPKCNELMKYCELEIKWGKRTIGRVDGVFKLRISKGVYKYYLLDYKTTSIKAIMAHRKTRNVFPYIANRYQIQAYCSLIQHIYRLKISGWLLAYISRDSPNWVTEVVGKSIGAEKKKDIYQQLKIWDNQYDVVVKAKSYRELLPLLPNKLCATRAFYLSDVHSEWDECPYSKSCFKPKVLLQELKAIDNPKLKRLSKDTDL